jgi:hypothetical protein
METSDITSAKARAGRSTSIRIQWAAPPEPAAAGLPRLRRRDRFPGPRPGAPSARCRPATPAGGGRRLLAHAAAQTPAPGGVSERQRSGRDRSERPLVLVWRPFVPYLRQANEQPFPSRGLSRTVPSTRCGDRREPGLRQGCRVSHATRAFPEGPAATRPRRRVDRGRPGCARAADRVPARGRRPPHPGGRMALVASRGPAAG